MGNQWSQPSPTWLSICRYRNMFWPVARSSATSDVSNAIAEAHRCEVLDVLITGEMPVGGDLVRVAEPSGDAGSLSSVEVVLSPAR